MKFPESTESNAAQIRPCMSPFHTYFVHITYVGLWRRNVPIENELSFDQNKYL